VTEPDAHLEYALGAEAIASLPFTWPFMLNRPGPSPTSAVPSPVRQTVNAIVQTDSAVLSSPVHPCP